MLKVLSNILCDFDPKVKVIGQKAGICDGVPSTSALVFYLIYKRVEEWDKMPNLPNILSRFRNEFNKFNIQKHE